MFLFCTVFGPPRLQSVCPTLFFTLITEGDQCHFSEVLNWNRLCAVSWSPRSSFRPLGLLQHQLRTEIGGRTPVRTSEPGGGHLAAGWECWICSVLVYIRPPPPFETVRLLQRLSRHGRRRHLPHLSSLFLDHLHITPPYTQSPTPPPPLSVKERKTDICIASSYCTQFIWNLWVSIERAEKKKILCRINLLLSVFFSFFQKKNNSEK